MFEGDSINRNTMEIGKRFGRLIVLERVDDAVSKNGRHRARYLCKCDCGNEKITYGENLTGGKTLSCGCLQRERASNASIKHGDTDSRLYNVWSAMKRRCYNSSVPEYSRYGGRGITVCDEWRDDYSAFKKWAIEAGYDENVPRGECTIDRINVDGNYEPSNCRWITQKEQMNNVSYNHIIEYNGESHTVAEWAEIYDIPYSMLLQRLNYFGYSVEDALTKPRKH